LRFGTLRIWFFNSEVIPSIYCPPSTRRKRSSNPSPKFIDAMASLEKNSLSPSYLHGRLRSRSVSNSATCDKKASRESYWSAWRFIGSGLMVSAMSCPKAKVMLVVRATNALANRPLLRWALQSDPLKSCQNGDGSLEQL